MSDPRILRHSIVRIRAGAVETLHDAVAVESALEIRVDGQPLSVTLRTPGDDRDLTLGFLAGEGLVRSRADVVEVRERPASCGDEPDVADVTLAPGVTVDWSKFERHFAATAACGLCGRAHLESLRAGLRPVSPASVTDVERLVALPARLRRRQAAFKATGGLHAAAYCDASLEPQVLREDVGRHNAVDKVAGWLLEQGRYPIEGGVLWVSGRAGAEIVLKAARAGISILAAVGAPSSLAISLAESASMTLVGFLRQGRLNVYTLPERLASGPQTTP
jgi:FdhD protein